MIFFEALIDFANRADNTRAQVAHTAYQVDNASGRGIEIHAANREIASLYVILDRSEAHRGGVAAVKVFGVGAEGRDLEMMVAENHHDHTETCAHGDRMVEKLLHLRGQGIGGDIVVLWGDPEDLVAHASAREIGGKACGA